MIVHKGSCTMPPVTDIYSRDAVARHAKAAAVYHPFQHKHPHRQPPRRKQFLLLLQLNQRPAHALPITLLVRADALQQLNLLGQARIPARLCAAAW